MKSRLVLLIGLLALALVLATLALSRRPWKHPG